MLVGSDGIGLQERGNEDDEVCCGLAGGAYWLPEGGGGAGGAGKGICWERFGVLGVKVVLWKHGEKGGVHPYAWTE